MILAPEGNIKISKRRKCMIPGFAVVCAPWTLQEGPRSATASSSANLFMTTSCAPLVGHVARFWSLNWPTSSAGSLILAGLANGFFIFSSFLSLSPPRPPSPPLVQVFQQRACPAGLQDGLYHLKCSWLWLVVVCWINVTVVVFSSFFFTEAKHEVVQSFMGQYIGYTTPALLSTKNAW